METFSMKRKPRPLHFLSLEDRALPSSVQGAVFDDANSNQIFDPGEAALPGWTVVDLRKPSVNAVAPVRNQNTDPQRNRLIDLSIADADLQPILVAKDMSNENWMVFHDAVDCVTDLNDEAFIGDWVINR
jgi:hypothetical protein